MFSGIAKKLAKIAWKVSCHNHTTDLILIRYKSWTLFAFNKCIPLSKHFNLCKANFMITNQPITIVFRAKKTTLVSQWLLIFQKNPSRYKMPWSHLEIDFFFLIWVVHVIMSIVLRGCSAFSDLYIFLCRWSCYSSLHTSVWWVQVLPKSKDKSLQHNSVSELKMVTIGLLATEFLFSFKWKAHYLWTDFVNRDKQSIAKCALLSTN